MPLDDLPTMVEGAFGTRAAMRIGEVEVAGFVTHG